MRTIPAIPTVMVVESGQALPPLLYGWLDKLGLDVLGPTDDLFDAYRLARDMQPRLAIIDKRIGGDCSQHVHAMLASQNVPCFDLAVSACRRREGLAVLEKAIVHLCGFAPRQALAGERGGGLLFYVGQSGIAAGSCASSGVHRTA
jgi:hypothetical protein